MERQERREQILNILAAGIRKVLLNTVPKPEELQEIRMRLGQPLRVVRGKEEIVLRSGTEPYIVTKEGQWTISAIILSMHMKMN